MSWQATRAVSRHSKFIEDRDFAAYRILSAIADSANSDGICGVIGDPRRCFSYTGIARDARVHKNTVYNLMPTLLESGELEVVEQGGSGRGSWTVYRVTIIERLSQQEIGNAPFVAESSQQTAESSQDKGVTIDLVTIIERLSQQVERLSQQIEESSQQKQESSQEIVTIVTTHGCDSSIEYQDEYQNEYQGEEEPPLPPNPSSAEVDADWQTAVKLVDRWATKRGIYRELKPVPNLGDPPDDADFYKPAARLISEMQGNGDQAWALVEAKYQQMLAANITPRRLEPVVSQILADLDGANAPPTAVHNQSSGNGQNKGVDIAKIFEELGLSHE